MASEPSAHDVILSEGDGGHVNDPPTSHTQAESPEAKCPRFALIRCRMRSRALRKLQMHTIAPKGYRNGQMRSCLSADALCHPKSSLKARARANGNGVEVGGRGERSKPWEAGIVIRKHYLRLSLVCGSIAWAGLSQLPCPLSAFFRRVCEGCAQRIRAKRRRAVYAQRECRPA